MHLSSSWCQLPLSSLYHLLVTVQIELHLLSHFNLDLLGLILVLYMNLDNQEVLWGYEQDALIAFKQDLKDFSVSNLLVLVVLNYSEGLSSEAANVKHLVEVRLTELIRRV